MYCQQSGITFTTLITVAEHPANPQSSATAAAAQPDWTFPTAQFLPQCFPAGFPQLPLFTGF